ncbi:hypothetical protein Pint_25319 [Pistacia integerrima]|uniref:Uncharacterized protein n=1 Tax=Pistacia integerrima TaxID=434235 RepID=A0ACC0YIN3_9ROSI|nr:hypothetical protein Pint_25319 [Pistacia integerrima]
MILWTLCNFTVGWQSCLQVGLSGKVQNTPRISCVFAETVFGYSDSHTLAITSFGLPRSTTHHSPCYAWPPNCVA